MPLSPTAQRRRARNVDRAPTHTDDETSPTVGDGPHGVAPALWRDHVLYAERRDAAALARLMHEYDRYARSLAARMHRYGEPREDLDQVAREALLVSLNRFDPARRLPFAALATPTILGTLRRHYRDRGWLLRVPRGVHELTTEARTTSERLTAQLGRKPTMPEIADAMNVGLEDLLAAQEAVYARDTTSLDAPTADGFTLGERIQDADVDLSGADDRIDLRTAIADIDQHEQHVLRLYYFEECTQAEIGQRLGISQMQVSRLIANILGRLRTQMTHV